MTLLAAIAGALIWLAAMTLALPKATAKGTAARAVILAVAGSHIALGLGLPLAGLASAVSFATLGAIVTAVHLPMRRAQR